MRLSQVVCWSVVVGCGVLSLPQGEWPGPTAGSPGEPVTSTSRPKRDGSQALCSEQLVEKRDAPCCGSEPSKECCGVGADSNCCGQKQAETIKSKRDTMDSSNDTLCCGKNRLARALAATRATVKPTSPSPSSPTSAPVLVPTRVIREDNKSCCGVQDSGDAAQDRPKRSSGAMSCCGGAISQTANPPPNSDKFKGRLVRDTCCGLQGDNTKKCCGVEAASALAFKSKRCIHTTTSAQ